MYTCQEIQKSNQNYTILLFGILGIVALFVGLGEFIEYRNNLPGDPVRPSYALAGILGAEFESLKDITPVGTLRKEGRTVEFKKRNGDPSTIYRAHFLEGAIHFYNSSGKEIDRPP